jgi:secondary thiamine-phosphate synthase enzyme
MQQAMHHLHVETKGKGLFEFTAEVNRWLAAQKIETGLLTLFCRHTSASLLVQENADPDVQKDLLTFFENISPEGKGLYVHDTEGPDDMPAHIRTALTQVQLAIPVETHRLALGTWQGIYLFEHRAGAHRRDIVLHLLGE